MEGEDIDCLTECEYVPDGTFTPVVKHHWSAGTVMMAPIVVQLDDDNCDGVVDEKDIPEILFNEFFSGAYNNNGRLHAISIIDGEIVEKWAFQPASDRVHPGREIAAGDLDGQPGVEIVMCTENNKVRAVDAEGNPLWTSTYAGGCIHPSIVDMDGDGLAEVLVERAMLDGATGATKLDIPQWIGTVTGVDVNDDGEMEIVGATKAYNIGGGLVAETNLGGLHPAIGDFDLDGKPEVAVIDNAGNINRHHLIVWRHDPNMPGNVEIIRDGIDINGPLSNALCPANSAGNKGGGGPPTVADFNGDGTPDVAVAGGVGYAVFDGAKLMDPQVADIDTVLWIKQTKDCSSAQTGSSVFDFDGDGSAEVVYSDEHYLRIYRGSDGEVLWQTCNTTGTLREFPLVADVENDGQADIVAVSNNYSSITCEGTKQTGVRVFGDAQGQWVRTRRIWNQHSYHVTNVNEDGSIPAQELANWLEPGLNNFRQNVQPDGEFSAPDLVVELKRRCPPSDDYALVGRVRNIGEAPAPAGVPVYFYEGEPGNGGVQFAQGVTMNVLYPAQAEDVVVSGDMVPLTVQDGTTPVWVVVDDEEPVHPWKECRTDNNSDNGTGECKVLG